MSVPAIQILLAGPIFARFCCCSNGPLSANQSSEGSHLRIQIRIIASDCIRLADTVTKLFSIFRTESKILFLTRISSQNSLCYGRTHFHRRIYSIKSHFQIRRVFLRRKTTSDG
ncbi:hypothetical protein CDAR_494841 [Caerostris darwini]|uniref:Secreted protein n=1 Tax=Caerostris darwini TaxID=1538125 RepID=A0AAV4QKX3_9ARAC|nr:hypothetical protein CDAR_494841 [Caerostris darwini]